MTTERYFTILGWLLVILFFTTTLGFCGDSNDYEKRYNGFVRGVRLCTELSDTGEELRGCLRTADAPWSYEDE